MQVGAWSAMTGYSLAFPRNSKYKDVFDKKIMEMRENGTISNSATAAEVQIDVKNYCVFQVIWNG